MFNKTLLCLLSIIVISPFYVIADDGAVKEDHICSEDVLYNESGLKYFEEGFYHLIPQGLLEDASHQFDLAVREFEKSLAVNPLSRETRINLARTYHAQKEFLLEAEQYRKLTKLDPYDIDSFILSAKAYAEAGLHAEAEKQLQTAKTRTSDPSVTQILDNFITKLEQEQQIDQ